MRIDRTWLAAILVAAFGVHAVAFLLYPPGDVYGFVREWYRELMAGGFSEPVGNYAPPYLYLLYALTLLDGLLWQVVLIKLLSVAGMCWTAFGVLRVLRALNAPGDLAILIFAMPSMILDVSLLGQADTFWVAPCLFATAAAIENKCVRVAFWSGIAFAFKAQAAVFAPFVIYLFVWQRTPAKVWAVAPLAFLSTMLPAWLAGWPVSYLFSIYVGQAQWVNPVGDCFVGNGASWWTTFGYLAPCTAYNLRWLGFPLAAVGLAIYWRFIPRPEPKRLLPAAAISASMVPFILPLMLERFFLLADLLAFAYALARPSRRSIIAAACMQVASALPIFVWAFRLQPLEGVASLFAAVAIFLLARELFEESEPAVQESSSRGGVTPSRV